MTETTDYPEDLVDTVEQMEIQIALLQAALRSICRWPVLYADGKISADGALKQVALDATAALEPKQ